MTVNGGQVPDRCIVILSNGHKITANKGVLYIKTAWENALEDLNS